jgi:hypothetical protein
MVMPLCAVAFSLNTSRRWMASGFVPTIALALNTANVRACDSCNSEDKILEIQFNLSIVIHSASRQLLFELAANRLINNMQWYLAFKDNILFVELISFLAICDSIMRK